MKKTSVETFACVRVVFTFVNPPNRVLYLLTFSETSVFMESGFLILLLPIVFLECKSKFVFIYSLSVIFFFNRRTLLSVLTDSHSVTPVIYIFSLH